MATETLALFEHLEFDFLEEFDVFPLLAGGEHEIITHQHSSERSCTATTRTSTASVQSREKLQNTVVWLSCGFDRPPSRDAVDRFLTDLEHVVDEVSTARRAGACRGLLDLTYSIDSTDVRTMPADQDASKGYDPTAEEYYHGYGCTIDLRPGKDPDCRGVHREQASVERWRCASRVTRSPSRNRSGCFGDSAYDIRWLARPPAGRRVVPVARTTHETPTIRKTSSTGSKPASTNTARTFS